MRQPHTISNATLDCPGDATSHVSHRHLALAAEVVEMGLERSQSISVGFVASQNMVLVLDAIGKRPLTHPLEISVGLCCVAELAMQVDVHAEQLILVRTSLECNFKALSHGFFKNILPCCGLVFITDNQIFQQLHTLTKPAFAGRRGIASQVITFAIRIDERSLRKVIKLQVGILINCRF